MYPLPEAQVLLGLRGVERDGEVEMMEIASVSISLPDSKPESEAADAWIISWVGLRRGVASRSLLSLWLWRGEPAGKTLSCLSSAFRRSRSSSAVISACASLS